MKNGLLALLIVSLLGCATTDSLLDNRQGAIDALDNMDIALDQMDNTQNSEPKEIIGSGADGTVLHKDIIMQNAKPGDYITVFRGKRQNPPKTLNQDDIDYSKAQIAKMEKELLDTKPGSVRALLDELVIAEKIELSGTPSESHEIPYSTLKGKVIEYISDIRDGKQIILIVATQSNKNYFDQTFITPPWIKSTGEIPPNLVSFTLAKRVYSNENKVFSFSEDIEATKNMIQKVISTEKKI